MDEVALLEKAQAWADNDTDPATAAEVRALISAKNLVELEDRFATSLEFGTAGLRGIIGGGTNRINRAVVRRTTAGLVAYLKATVPDIKTRGVVVGRDGRRMSETFVNDIAGIFAFEGIPAWVFLETVPTPVVAFAVRYLNTAAAVMVTASHNPPEYNGYKVYWGNGAQIIPPHDVGIAKAIEAVGPANKVKVLGKSSSRAQGLWKDAPERVENAYYDEILALRPSKLAGALPIVYTAMHGVGGRWMLHALKAAGFTSVAAVTQQQEPDGTFPTVRFPNPEETGAMDLATALAVKTNAELVLANDPDADRLAVMARDGKGVLRMLTGNETGVLLGHYLLTHRAASKNTPLVLTTIVSSAQLKAIAAAKGARYEETLTGFKWIANRAMELEPSGFDFVMGYEEALGYTVGTVARDKDGIGSALVVADMAAWCKSQGMTLLTYLERVQREHGLFVATQHNATLPGATGAATIKAVMQAFREKPCGSIGEWQVEATNDYQAQTRVSGGKTTPLSLPKSNVLAWELNGGSRVTLRPSGTEPKIKVYLELREAVGADEPMEQATERAKGRLAELQAAFLGLAKERGLP